MALRSIRKRRLFEQHTLRERVAPFAVVYVVGFSFYPLGGGADYSAWLAAAALVALTTLALIAYVPWSSLPGRLQLTPLVLFIASVALLREAHGGPSSGYAPLVVVAAIWAGLFGTRSALAVVLCTIALVLILPPLVSSGPTAAAGELRRTTLLILVTGLSGYVVQLLVRALLAAEQQLALLRANDIHDDVVQAFAVAQLAISQGRTQLATKTLSEGLASAQHIASTILADALEDAIKPGALRRTTRTSG